jgi:hypothetical protein
MGSVILMMLAQEIRVEANTTEENLFLTNHFRHVKANFRQGLLRGDEI